MNQRYRRKKKTPAVLYILMVTAFILFIIGTVFMVKRYKPTKERMTLEEYFQLQEEAEGAVILNGEYKEVAETGEYIHAICNEDGAYLQLDFLKKELDDGYVYDRTEDILRYATDDQLITATLNSPAYSIDKKREALEHPVVISHDDTYFIALDFIQLFTDITYHTETAPNRIVIETAGFEIEKAVLKRDVPLRRFGGVKSKILKDGAKGEEVGILEDYGKWSYVITEDGVLACVQNRKLEKTHVAVTEKRLEEREYQHHELKDTISLGWHQVTNRSANATVEEVLAKSDINVISPTWFYINDNQGNIENLASLDYVSYCHERNVQVWGLVSNLENKEVDTTTVLNTTSARDQLVNSLISAAITYNLDGINVDMEALSGMAKDGYIQFIRELSIKCEKNDIILSVDNYVPTSATAFYNRSEQAKYADYVVIMAYDEHYSGSEEAGSVASLGFVEKGVKDTLEEVPAEQIILGMPFYARVWEVTDTSIRSKAYGMEAMEEYLKRNDVTTTWLEEEGQNYGEFVQGDTTYMAWVEDVKSLTKKLEVMKKYKLAGAAFWKLGFEKESTWQTIGQYTK